MDMSTGLLLKHRGIAGVQRRRGIDVCKRILGRYGGKQVKRRTVAQGGASEVSDGGHGHGLRSVSQMRTLTLESVNEIYVIGLYDKCRTRHRVKVAVVTKCGKGWYRSRDVNMKEMSKI